MTVDAARLEARATKKERAEGWIWVIMIRNRMSKSNLEADRDLYSGLIRLHVLHHAAEGPVFGLGMIEELGRHGYKVSPGSLYPLLQGLEKKGYLRSAEKR